MSEEKKAVPQEQGGRKGREPKFIEALLLVVVILAALLYLIVVKGVQAQIALAFCLLLASAFALYLGFSWNRVEEMIKDGVRVGILAMIINLMIGMLVSAWCSAGVVPYLIDVGMKIISPRLFLPMTCIICCILSVCCGSSWTTAGTVGLALYGIGTTMGIPGPMIVGPILTGAYFGDKMSPISESTITAATAAETNMYSHLHSMLFVVVPATILSWIFYAVIGWQYGATEIDTSALAELSDTLNEVFWLNPLLLIPLVVLTICIFKKMDAIPALGIAILLGIVFSLTQGFSFMEICTALYSGLSLETGTQVDELLGQGGLTSMNSVITIILTGMPLGGLLRDTGTLNAIIYHFRGIVSSPGNVVAASTVNTTALCFLTGNSYGACILNCAAFGPAFDDWNINRKCLSRICELGVIVQCLAPWTSGGAYMSNLFGMSTFDYAPYYVWGPLCIVITIICGYTGFGMFYDNSIRGGRRGWGKNKYVPDYAAVRKKIAERREGAKT